MAVSKKATLELKEMELKVQQLELENEKLGWESKLIKGQPVRNGEFALLGPIDDDMVWEMCAKLSTWSNLHPKKPITLLIDSPGGYVPPGFSMFDHLQRLKKKGHHITTIGQGMCASMGGILLQAGDERVMTERAWMLIHEVAGLAEGPYSVMKNALQFNARLQAQALDVLAARATVTRKTIQTKWKEDWWLSPKEALKYGFIDRIEEG